LRHAPVAEQAPLLAAPSEAQDIAGDYRSMSLTLGRHPVALLRQRLLAMRLMPADVLHSYANGQFARGCGIVTVRQRPETAHGVLFVTLEDETGLENVIVWPSLVEQQRREVLGRRCWRYMGSGRTSRG
jgi:error-prone DNA polymerase